MAARKSSSRKQTNGLTQTQWKDLNKVLSDKREELRRSIVHRRDRDSTVDPSEIIEELEPDRRGPYGGAVGYFSFSGNLDSCITIRTIILKGKTAYVQAGAGIVADSKPEKEHQETLNKARALLKAIEIAQKGLL